MTSIRERIQERPLVFDGAMGTMLYERGVFINACYDELALSNPDVVRGVHADYVRAGADLIETNTFGANRVKLRPYGLGDRVEEINRRATEIARQVADAAQSDILVAGSVGPCLKPGQVLAPDNESEVAEAFAEQTKALADAGVDYIQFETFSNPREIEIAAEAAGSLGVPLGASFAFSAEGNTALGGKIEDIVHLLDGLDAIALIGINCGVGPASMLDLAERALSQTRKPVFVMPNAGLPREVEGRMIYLTSPEYFTEYSRRLVELGVRGIGGCCGTTPAHIREMAKAVKVASGVKKHVQIQVLEPEEIDIEPVPMAEKSRLASKLSRGEKVTSVEILPPRSCDLSHMLEQARRCYLHGVDAMNIPDGPRASSRVSPLIASIAIKNEIGIEPVLHYCCRDRNLIGMQSDLMGAYAAGIPNILIITGDPPKLGDYPDATGVFDVDAIGLVQVANRLNHGRDIGNSRLDPPAAIFAGVGANPCAVEFDRELERFERKVQAGAEFAITQPVFDTAALFRFLDAIEERDCAIPVIAGVWPLVSYKNAEFMNNEVPGVEIPEAILERMKGCTTKEAGRAEGVAVARDIRDAVSDRVAGFQVSAPFGNVDIALAVLGLREI